MHLTKGLLLHRYLIVSALLTLLLSPFSDALTLPNSSQFESQRTKFLLASKDIRHQKFKQANQKIKQLTAYPLLPYLEYQLLLKRLSSRSLAEITSFITQYHATPLAQRLRLKAILAKAKYRQWDDVKSLYRLGDSVAYQCANLRAIYHIQGKRNALSQVEQIWLTGNSLPKSCDSLLAAWKKSGYQTQQLIWQRIELALIARKRSLAKYLAKSLSKTAHKDFKYWYRLYARPTKLSQRSYWLKQGQFASTMLKIAAERLIYQQPEKAYDIWPQIVASKRLKTDVLARLTTRLALALITEHHPAKNEFLAKINWDNLTKSQNSQLLRAFVGQSRWTDITSYYQQQRQPDLAWKYWYAGALAHLGQQKQAKAIYQKLATNRRYYGFLASDKLNIPYQLNHLTLKPQPTISAKITSLASIARVKELLLIDRRIEARREWYHLLKTLNEPERIAAAVLADSWQWHNRAIITLTMTQQRDDLDIRFPTPFLSTYQQEAKINNISPSWTLAISRQESAFMDKARSHAGAMGLMQLLHGTAKLQAKVSKVKYRTRAQLLEPKFNIKLGTGYLTQMLGKFDNNIAVAAAAYNAGPHRVKRWVKDDLPQDQWIETIPYRETREYVKNILAYTVIYQRHLQQKSQLPSAAIRPALMKILH